MSESPVLYDPEIDEMTNDSGKRGDCASSLEISCDVPFKDSVLGDSGEHLPAPTDNTRSLSLSQSVEHENDENISIVYETPCQLYDETAKSDYALAPISSDGSSGKITLVKNKK
eukprot:Rmarinus@m.12861